MHHGRRREPTDRFNADASAPLKRHVQETSCDVTVMNHNHMVMLVIVILIRLRPSDGLGAAWTSCRDLHCVAARSCRQDSRPFDLQCSPGRVPLGSSPYKRFTKGDSGLRHEASSQHSRASTYGCPLAHHLTRGSRRGTRRMRAAGPNSLDAGLLYVGVGPAGTARRAQPAGGAASS